MKRPNWDLYGKYHDHEANNKYCIFEQELWIKMKFSEPNFRGDWRGRRFGGWEIFAH